MVAGVVAAYLEHRDLAEMENAAERFFMNVVLCRVLYAHGRVAAPRISLGWLRPLAPVLGDPRLWMSGIFLQLSRVLPDEYPLTDQLYEWSAHELGEPGLLDCTRQGALTYAWRYEDRGVWKPRRSILVRMADRALPPERPLDRDRDQP